MGGAIKSVTSAVGKGLGAVVTGGANIYAPNSSLGKLGNQIGGALTLDKNTAFGGGSGGGPGVPGNDGKVSPMQALMNTGGAPLLASIAMGVNHTDAIAQYFGVDPKDYNSWKAQLDPQSQQAIGGLESTLGQVASNTAMKTQAVQKLVNDFPDFMADAIPKYKGIADAATMGAAQQALSQTAAKYAAGGQLSSGATAAAMARTGADFAYKNLSFGTDLAGQDWLQKFNSSNALLNFQQKMLGQGATAGQSAIQKMWDINAGAGKQTQELQFKQNTADQQASGALFGTIGKVGGGIIGGAFGGPEGAAAGSAVGGAVGTYAGSKQ